MENLTYRELLALLAKLDDSRLDDNVSVYMTLADEVVPVMRTHTVMEDDQDTPSGVLDEGHLVLLVRV